MVPMQMPKVNLDPDLVDQKDKLEHHCSDARWRKHNQKNIANGEPHNKGE